MMSHFNYDANSSCYTSKCSRQFKNFFSSVTEMEEIYFL